MQGATCCVYTLCAQTSSLFNSKKKEEEEEVSSDLMKTLPAAPASHSRGYADPLGPLFSTMCAQPCSSLDQQ